MVQLLLVTYVNSDCHKECRPRDSPRAKVHQKGEKTCLDSRPTRMQNFTPLSFSVAEKSVTVQTNKITNKITHSKLNTPKLPYGGIISKVCSENFPTSVSRVKSVILRCHSSDPAKFGGNTEKYLVTDVLFSISDIRSHCQMVKPPTENLAKKCDFCSP